MIKAHTNTLPCPVCRQSRRQNELMHGELIRPGVVALVQKVAPSWTSDDVICHICLHRFRVDYIEAMLLAEKGELTDLDSEVLRSMKEQELLSRDINQDFVHRLSVGDRLADKVAEFGGSWRFIILFGFVCALWIGVNGAVLLWRPFDPYPFILLNLILSCLAALQAPVIMMSQNRQDAKDRMRSEFDYRINLKAELEIRHLHAKMDQLLTHQWQHLLEIQRIQMDLLQELAGRK
jgi:uncharacterized membrane protein